MTLPLVLIAAALLAGSGVPALVLRAPSAAGQWLSTALVVGAALLGLSAVGSGWAIGDTVALSRPWSVPGASFSVYLDDLAAWFLLPVFLVPAFGAVFGLEYWKSADHPQSSGSVLLFSGLLSAGMVLLVVARNSILFLVGWETMALAAFFLVAADDALPETRRAAWVYLVATHLGTMALLAMFGLLHAALGSFDWAPVAPGALAPLRAALIFLLALLGFGLKAGIMPLHVWLPSAHACAPSHVSAVMSGVMIKMGIYGLLRVCALLPLPPLWWGLLLMAMGALSSVIAAAAALAQHDFKRMLAYSSIENVGLIVLGVGIALVGRALHQGTLVALGLGGALLHVLNHSLFKSLLFFSAGSLLHATGTRRIDQLGGLARAMPVTLLAFLAGTLAVSAAPGLNGFPSEALLYLGLFHVAAGQPPLLALLAALCAAALALTGAIALAGFVRAFGAVFLGSARSPHAAAAHESAGAMRNVLLGVGALCVTLGLLPALLAARLDGVARLWAGESPATLGALAPLGTFGWVGLAMLLAMSLGPLLLRRAASGAPGAPAPVGTWDCGYVDPSSPRLQYTASSFGGLLVGLFGWAVAGDRTPHGPLTRFPAPFAFASHPRERLLAGLIVPFLERMARRFARVRILQQGRLHVYLLYILGVLLVGIAWAALSPWVLG
jgi:hydrogenase-4 component B